MIAGLSNDTLSLAIGTALAIGALAFVLAPLVSTRAINEAQNADAPSTPTDLHAGIHVNNTNDTTSATNNDDAVEAAIRRARANLKSCVRCGPRVEPDATYCSNCGKYLPGVCDRCHADVTGTGAAFCGACGVALNAFV